MIYNCIIFGFILVTCSSFSAYLGRFVWFCYGVAVCLTGVIGCLWVVVCGVYVSSFGCWMEFVGRWEVQKWGSKNREKWSSGMGVLQN